MKKPSVIGIVGTAKNTGKTTTLNCLLTEAARRNISAAVTGIGYDGEEIDTITQLPKPRITVYKGMVVATSERCIAGMSQSVEVLEHTGLFTPLGEVIILRMLHTGLIVIAGPNKRNDLQTVIDLLNSYSVQKIFVDGSLNRIAPMAVADRIVVTTGGSRSENTAVLASELHAIETVLLLPDLKENTPPDLEPNVIPDLLIAEDVHIALYRSFGRSNIIEVAGLVSVKALELFADLVGRHRYNFEILLFRHPFDLLMNEDILRISTALTRIHSVGIAVKVRRSPALSCFTANPFVPVYSGTEYTARYLDSTKMLERLRSSCSRPVYNTSEISLTEFFSAVCQDKFDGVMVTRV